MRVTETERLYIDEATTDEASFFFRLLNSEGWLTHIGDRNIKSEEDAAQYIAERLMKSYVVNGYGLYVMKLKETLQPVGICGFVKRDYLSSADLGFAILPKYESKGYTTEASEKLIEFGFTNLSFDEILGITSPANIKSQRLLLKLGFSHAGESQPDKNSPPALLFSIKNLPSY